MDRLEQIVIPQHSTLAQPRVQVTPEGANPVDLTSAIVHELQRSNNQPGWHSWNHQLGGIQASPEQAIGLQVPSYGSYLYHQNAGTSSRPLLQNIPRFEESLAPSMPQMPTMLDYSTEAESLASAHQGFYSRSANGIPLHLGQQVHHRSFNLHGFCLRVQAPEDLRAVGVSVMVLSYPEASWLLVCNVEFISVFGCTAGLRTLCAIEFSC